MTQTAKVITHSVSPQGIELCSMQLRYPKFIHGEAKTHRVIRIADKAYEFLEEVGFMDDPALSRNASSSRAIPVERLIQDVIDDPAMPVFWGKNQPGMQAVEEMTAKEQEVAEWDWLNARDLAVMKARHLASQGLHKQLVNRIIEPWCHINVVVTATEWSNFFALRRHKDAQPEMKALADAMWDAMQASTPKMLQPGEWHLPYVSEDDRQEAYWSTRHLGRDNSECFDEEETNVICLKASVARCARVSYLTHEGKPPNIEDDLKLYDRLAGSVPLHASPCEHEATPDEWLTHDNHGNAVEWKNPELHGNLRGWIQYRKTLPNENAA